MKIYYFTGTGNTLDIAKHIAKKTNAELQPIHQNLNQTIKGDSIGIAFPILMFNAPHMVYKFIEQIKECDYLYLIMTMGGNSGNATEKIKDILEKNDILLSAGFSFMMPDNYIVWNGAMPKAKQDKLFKWSNERIQEVAEKINGKISHFDDEEELPNVSKGIPFPLNKIPFNWIQFVSDMGFKRIPKMDKGFIINDMCNGCETCAKICPTKNIKMVDKEPTWHQNCEQCYACIQWCPKHAIEYKKKTVGKKRYTNPHVQLKEMF